MSSNDAGDGSPPPDTDTEPESSIMAEDKKLRPSSEEKSPNSNSSKKVTKSNAKDPSRPRRKKARRACFACQRAHLTCGDERPCFRCVKRGLQDSCHDGARKKAKYLHDAPPEALLPGYQGTYALNGSGSTVAGSAPMVQSSGPVAQPNNNYFPAQNTGFPQYSPVSQSTQMSQQVMDSSNMVGNVTHQPSVSSPGPFQQTSGQQVTPAPGLSNPLNQQHIGSISNPSFEASLFDPNDPSMFNFNISDLNFGNQYGALEFGMLGHMTAGAMNTPEMEMLDAMSHSNQGSISYDNTASFPPFPYTQNFQPWVNNRQGSTTNLWALQHNGQDAFAVADTTTSLTGASPHSQNQDWTHLSSSNVSPEARFVQPDQTRHSDSHHHHSHRRSAPFPSDFGTLFQRKRRADTKQIYASVTKGYPYTERFHRFMEFLNKRFPSDKKVRIAKALATIRPSFIALTKDLSEDDLIFMEQGFQRQLIDYDDTWQQIGTPSIICRRTGEIVSCNKEFSLVTGWSRDVLLGKQPNLNVNFGTSASGTQTGSSTRGAVTPRVPNMSSETDTSLPQPVFLAEIMNQDSTVEFWEDFAERAFGASTSSMDGVMCTLIKYKTKDDAGWGPEDRLKADEAAKKESSGSKGEHFIRGEAGMKALGERNGEIEVCMTWLVRRDMFEVPMMIVMNFLPMI